MPLSEWRGDLTLFDGFYSTAPATETSAAPWKQIVHAIAPADGLVLVVKKDRGPYFVGCLLKVAPLIGETLAKAQRLGLPTAGKQRSASHVTEAREVSSDFDGIADKQLAAIEQRLSDAGLSYLAYSSHSHGRADKPGVRCRLIVPVDAALNSADYKRAAQGLNASMLDGLADPAGFALHQQMGVWATAPERAHLAFRREHRAGVCSAAALLAAAPEDRKPALRLVPATSGPLSLKTERVSAALAWLDADDYKTWVDAAIWIKAAYGDAAYPLWMAWSQTADELHRADEGECQRVWDSLETRITAEQGAGALFAHARDEALGAAKQAAMTGQWKGRGTDALVYLRSYHPSTFAENFTEGVV